MLTLAISVHPVRAIGTIIINADGSISPSTTLISTVDNVTYTFTGNIDVSIVVQRDNIVLDGAGYTLQAPWNENGFSLSGVSNVTIENTTITRSKDGIDLNYSSGNVLSGNNITASSSVGINLASSSNNTVYGNSITRNSNGVWLLSSSNNTISKNNVTTNFPQSMDRSPMESDPVFGVGVVLIDSSNNAVSKNNIQNNVVGVALGDSSNNAVSENIITNNYGIGIDLELSDTITPLYSSNNVIYHNNFINNAHQAFGGLQNVWDDGYPSGGNYWSDHNPSDADKDKIGDSSYIIDGNNTDKYPLIYPYEFYQPAHVPKHDINNDGTVNIIDVATVARAFGCKPGDSNWNPAADMDINEIINIIDVAKVAKDYGKTV
jgi:parallel beta-helix repeat protein